MGMRVCFCRAGLARVYVVVSVGVCNSLSCIRVGCKSKGRGLSACLALNAPATPFFLPDRVLLALWKSEPWKLALPRSLVKEEGRVSRKRIQPCSQPLAVSVGTRSFLVELFA